MAAEDYIEFDACYDEMDDGPRIWRPGRQYRPGEAKGRLTVGFNLPHNHGQPWSEYDDQRLATLWHKGETVSNLMQAFGRTQTSIRSRLERLGFDPDNRPDPRHLNVTTNRPEPKDLMMTDFQHLLALLQHGYTTVDVCFPENPGQRYTYKIPSKMAEGLKPKDYLVVPARSDFKLVQVAEVHPTPRIDVKKPLALKWVVQRVDFTAYNDQTSREAEAIEKLQVAERAAAQKKALEVLLGSIENRDEILKLIQVG